MSSYREQEQFLTSSEGEDASLSPPSDKDSNTVLGVISSPSSEYLVKSYLGEGAFGKVAKCFKMATKEMVAVKIMKHRTFTAETQNEVNILQELRAFDSDRYNFVKFNEAFVDSGKVCLEFELLDMSLLNFIRKKPAYTLTVKEIRPFLHQMAVTLQLLKSQGLVHADLKPDNIMLVDRVNQPMKVKMIDFGLACHVSNIQWGAYMQPRFYRAPEIILGSPFTAAIDMWSLGCIAAELFLGHALYPGNCEYDMLRHMVQTQGQLPQPVLKNGTKTGSFFKKKRKGRGWRLKTSREYGVATCSETRFNSLNDLKDVRPAHHLSTEDTKAETEDQDNFVELLKKMLHLDVSKRITPSLLLEDPFITMRDLADDYPNSFYMKSCCEMMEVCQGSEVQQPSTSTSSQNQYISQQDSPAWHHQQELPVILDIASSVSSDLSIHDDETPSHSQEPSFSTQQDQGPSQQPQPSFTVYREPGSPVMTDVDQSCSYRLKHPRKMKRDSFEATLTCNRSPESERKKMKMDACVETKRELPENTSEAPTETTSSTAEAKPSRKRTWDTFVAAHSGLRKPDNSSPKKKKMKMSPDAKEAPAEAPSSVADIRPQRKRTWDTFKASYIGLRKPKCDSPERKKMKMSPEAKEAPAEAPSSVADIRPQRKRTWDTFKASYIGLRKPKCDSPERKKMKMSPEAKEAPAEAPSSVADIRPQRKRTWDTFKASYIGLRKRKCDSTEKKKMKMIPEAKEAPAEAPSSVADIRPQRKRTFKASFIGLRKPKCDSPERKNMKMIPEAKEAPAEAPSSVADIRPQRKRTFKASFIGLRKPKCDSTEKKKMKMIQAEEKTDTTTAMSDNACQASSSSTTDPQTKCDPCKKPDRRSTRKKKRSSSDEDKPSEESPTLAAGSMRLRERKADANDR